MWLTLSILESDDPPPQPQDPTAAEDQEESTPKTRAEDASGSAGGDATPTPGEDAFGDVIEMSPSTATTVIELSIDEPEATTEDPAGEETSFGGSEYDSVGSTFAPTEFDQTAGSGFMSTEDVGISTMVPVGEPEATHHPTEHDESESDHETTQCKKNTCKKQLTHNCYK